MNNFNNKIKNKTIILIKASKIKIKIKIKIKTGKLKLNKGIKEKDLSVPQFGGTVPLKSGGGSSVATGNGGDAFFCLMWLDWLRLSVGECVTVLRMRYAPSA